VEFFCPFEHSENNRGGAMMQKFNQTSPVSYGQNKRPHFWRQLMQFLRSQMCARRRYSEEVHG
jgi:hypothetical protein